MASPPGPDAPPTAEPEARPPAEPEVVDLTPDTAVPGAFVRKTILGDGAGDEDELPKPYEQVTVTICGKTADGTVFKDGAERERFRLNKWALPTGLTLCIQSMRKGERCSVELSPEYGFDGEACPAPEGVDPAAPLFFEVELFKFKRNIDLTGDGGVAKSVLTSGEGKRAGPGSIVSVRVRAKLTTGVVVQDSFAEPTSLVIDAYDGECSVLDETLNTLAKSMRKGEHATAFVAAAYAYGSKGHAELGIPPHTDLEYDLELVDIEHGTDTTDMTPAEKIAAALATKEQGTAYFKAGNYERAVLKYSEVLTILEQDVLFPPEAKTESRTVKTAAGLNIAACQLKLGQHRDVVGICSALLQQDKGLVKALYRRAQASEKLNEVEASLADYKAASKLQPADQAIANGVKRLAKRVAAQDAKDQQKYKGMFG